jgi:hypothetical protein
MVMIGREIGGKIPAFAGERAQLLEYRLLSRMTRRQPVIQLILISW